MRFASLHLRAYGPFTNAVLDFETNPAGLQIVLGPNEAGKTSALRALTAFLFGVPGKTSDNFIHEHNALRIGGVLLGEDGRRHAFMRRKGHKVVLMQMDPSTGEELAHRPLSQDAIDALIPGVDQALFETLFGLSHAHLREGGIALAQGKGDVGSAIFAASAGLSDVRQALAQLDSEAGELFAPTARTKKINVALRGLEEAGKAYREALVRPKDWKERDQRAEEARNAHTAARKRYADATHALAELQQLKSLRPIAVNRQRLLEAIALLNDAPELPADAQSRAVTARERIASAKELIAAARERIALNQRELAKVVVAQAYLDAGVEIEALRAESANAWTQHQRAASLSASRDGQDAEVKELLMEVLPGVAASEASGRLPSANVAARLKEYARRLRHLDNLVANAERNADREHENIAKAEAALSLIAKPEDTSGLQSALDAARQGGDLEGAHSKLAVRLEQSQREISRSAAVLGFSDPETLLRLPLPQRADVEAFQRQFGDIAAEEKRLALDGARLNSDSTQLRNEMALLEASGAPVTLESLTQARDTRDRIWMGVKRAFVEQAAKAEEVCAELGLSGDLPQTYEQQVRLTDERADGLRTDAERSTKYSEHLRRVKDMGDALKQLANTREELGKVKSALERDWASVCTALGIAPKTPAALLEWMQSVEAVRRQAADRERLATEVEVAAQGLTTARASMVAALKMAGIATLADSSFKALIVQGTQHINAVSQVLNDIAQLERDKATATTNLTRAQAEASANEQRRQVAQDECRLDLAQIGLDAAASAEEVDARLEKLGELRLALQSLAATTTDIAKARSVWDGFVARMAVLLKDLGAELPQREEEWPLLASSANARLAEAQKAQARREHLMTALLADEAFVRAEEIKERGASATLADLAAQAQSQIDDLDAAIDRSQRKQQAYEDLRKQDELLGEYSKEEATALLTKAAALDAADLASGLVEAAATAQTLEADVEVARNALARAEAALQEIDGSADAAEHYEEMEHYLASARREAGNYMRLRLAHALLGTAIKTYQDKSQGPVMKAASKWFERLTGGRYAKLVVDYDEDDQVMLAERADGVRLTMNKLSEGTADQLYLALRLAAVEVRLDSTHAVPLVLDDALLAFDDARAMQALRAFSELGKRNQIVLFTHHAHVVRLAHENLAKEDFAVHELSGPTLPKTAATA